jgi:hypothetical protein
MPTYKNCFELVKEVRQGINEYDDALASGEETGAYRNETLIKYINDATRELFALIAKRRPNEFLKEVSLTGANSVFTLPGNFGKLVLFRDANGLKVHPMFQDERKSSGMQGSGRLYYQKGRTLVLDKDGIADAYTLIYKTKPRDLHQGKAFAVGTGTITLDPKLAPKIADHYVGMFMENVTADWAAEITAYTAARVATTGQTSAVADFYALVPEIPEWAHHLISPRAIIMGKLNGLTKDKLTKGELDSYQNLLLTAFREFCGQEEDTDWEEMFTSFEPKAGGIFLE